MHKVYVVPLQCTVVAFDLLNGEGTVRSIRNEDECFVILAENHGDLKASAHETRYYTVDEMTQGLTPPDLEVVTPGAVVIAHVDDSARKVIRWRLAFACELGSDVD
jgi:hypothetical protein